MTPRIALPTYYFAECDYLEATSLSSSSNGSGFSSDLIGIIAASCVIVCIFALAVITFARAEHNRAVSVADSASHLAKELETEKMKLKSEIMSHHSDKERNLIVEELTKIQADEAMNKLFLGMKLDAGEIQMKEIIGRGGEDPSDEALRVRR